MITWLWKITCDLGCRKENMSDYCLHMPLKSLLVCVCGKTSQCISDLKCLKCHLWPFGRTNRLLNPMPQKNVRKCTKRNCVDVAPTTGASCAGREPKTSTKKQSCQAAADLWNGFCCITTLQWQVCSRNQWIQGIGQRHSAQVYMSILPTCYTFYFDFNY